MNTLGDLIELESYYKTYTSSCFNVEDFEKAITLMEKDLPEILNDEREYPIFPYYIILAYLDGTYIRFSDLSKEDKEVKFKETVTALRTLLHSDVVRRMIEFLNCSRNFNLAYKHINIFSNFITYSFNVKEHLEDYVTLCDMMELRYDCGNDVLKIYFE